MERRSKQNEMNIGVGDTLEFTNDVGYKVSKAVTRITGKSYYSPSRES